MSEQQPVPPSGRSVDTAALQQQLLILQQQCQQEQNIREQLQSQVTQAMAAQQAAERLALMLSKSQNSPPRNMEVDTVAAAPAATFMDAVTTNNAHVFAAADALSLPRDQATWNAVCTPLMQKKTLTKMELATCVLGCAAFRGFADADPFVSAGNVLALFKLLQELNASEYKRVLSLFVQSGRKLDFFHEVCLTPAAAPQLPYAMPGFPVHQQLLELPQTHVH